MNDAANSRDGKSWAVGTWIMAVVIAFAIYLATFPMVLGLGIRWANRGSAPGTSGTWAHVVVMKTSISIAGSGAAGPMLPWYLWYGVPYCMVAAVPGLTEPLNGYLDWWLEKLS